MSKLYASRAVLRYELRSLSDPRLGNPDRIQVPSFAHRLSSRSRLDNHIHYPCASVILSPDRYRRARFDYMVVIGNRVEPGGMKSKQRCGL
jgi:hypothetical protein